MYHNGQKLIHCLGMPRCDRLRSAPRLDALISASNVSDPLEISGEYGSPLVYVGIDRYQLRSLGLDSVS
jgi:hypothetical protein